jgi:hypothetical protein
MNPKNMKPKKTPVHKKAVRSKTAKPPAVERSAKQTRAKQTKKSTPPWRKVAIGALLLSPFLLLVALVAYYAVNVPFWDQWELVTLIQKFHHGTLGFSDFFAQHNEHRLLFPRLFMFLFAWATHWNTYVEVSFSLVLVAVSAFFLYQILKRTFTNTALRLGAAAAVSLVLFSPMQWENWLWGWQIQWYLNITGLIIAVWALSTWQHKSELRRVLVAAAAAIVATYSLASGMFVWLICLPILMCNKALRRWLWLWIGLAIAAVGIHYIGYVNPAYHPSKTLFLHHPVNFLHYLLVYIARPVVIDYLLSARVAAAYLAAILVSLIYLLRFHGRQLTTTLLPWLCLGLYAALAAGSTAISRLGLGVEQAYSSRYTTLSQFLLIAFFVMLFKIIELSLTDKRKLAGYMRYGSVVVLTLLLQATLLNYGKGVVQMRQQHNHLLLVSACAHTATSPKDDCLLYLYPNKRVVWERLEYLRKVHWGGL